MPPAIAAIGAAAAYYAAGAAAGTAGFAIFGGSLLASAIAIGVGSFALSELSMLLQPQPKNQSGAINQSQTIMGKAPLLPREFVYGEVWKSGGIVYFTSTQNNQYFHYVIVIATHECDAIDTVWFNADPIYNTDLDAGGNVISGTYSGFARIKKHLGTDNQTVDPDLLAECPEITSTFCLSGCAYLYVRLQKNTTVYATGEPNISCWVRGKKVYDPRTSTTYWNPNPALCLRDYLINTRFGYKLPTAKIYDTSTISAANSNEEMVSTLAVSHLVSSVSASLDTLTLNTKILQFQTGDRVQVTTDNTLPAGISAVTNYFVVVVSCTDTVIIKLATSYANALARTCLDITDAGTGNHTVNKNAEPRYTCNGVLNTNMAPKDIINAIKTSMAGDLIPVGGLWLIKSGVYVAPTITIDQTMMLGSLTVQTKQTGRTRFNQVQGSYISPQNKGIVTDYPLITDTTFTTEDKGKLVTARFDLPMTSRAQTAQRIGRINLNRHRRQRTAQLTTNLYGLQLQAGDTMMLTFPNRSYVSKVFEIATFTLVPRKIKNDMALTCDMIINETDSAIYTFDETTQEIQPQPVQAAAVANPNYVTPPGAPGVITSQYTTTNGTGVKIKAVATYVASPDAFVISYQFEYKITTDSAYTVMPITSDTTVTIPDVAPGDYNARVLAISIFNKKSAYASATFSVSAFANTPEDVANFSAISLSDDVTLSWTQSTNQDVKNAGYVRLRHTTDTGSPTWSDARDVIDALPGVATQAHVPMLDGYYLAKFIDSAGNESANAAQARLVATQIFGMSLVATNTEETGFAGAKTNMTAASNVLRLTTTAGVQATSGSYQWQNYIDALAVTKIYATTKIALITYNSTNLFDSTAGNFDSQSGLFDGAAITGVTVKASIRTTQTDPSSSPTWSAWMPFVAGYFTGRGFQFKIDVASTNSSYQIDIANLAASVYVPDIHDSKTVTTSAGALATFNYNKTYTTVPSVSATIQDAVAGDLLVIPAANITSTNFKAGVLNSAAYVIRNITWTTRGY